MTDEPLLDAKPATPGLHRLRVAFSRVMRRLDAPDGRTARLDGETAILADALAVYLEHKDGREPNGKDEANRG